MYCKVASENSSKRDRDSNDNGERGSSTHAQNVMVAAPVISDIFFNPSTLTQSLLNQNGNCGGSGEDVKTPAIANPIVRSVGSSHTAAAAAAAAGGEDGGNVDNI
jgi:hypothetical protein